MALRGFQDNCVDKWVNIVYGKETLKNVEINQSVEHLLMENVDQLNSVS